MAGSVLKKRSGNRWWKLLWRPRRRAERVRASDRGDNRRSQFARAGRPGEGLQGPKCDRSAACDRSPPGSALPQPVRDRRRSFVRQRGPSASGRRGRRHRSRLRRRSARACLSSRARLRNWGMGTARFSERDEIKQANQPGGRFHFKFAAEIRRDRPQPHVQLILLDRDRVSRLELQSPSAFLQVGRLQIANS